MFRYVLALLIINAYSGSLGAPSNNSLSFLLSKLAKRCDNHFVAAQIENKILECDQSESIMKKQFECLMFYDINSQLCAAISQSKLNITEDFTAKVNEKYEVKHLCEVAKAWSFSKLSEKYLEDVKLVFQNPLKCASVCEVEDFTSDDAIFYCKYYNWGWQLLKSQEKVTAQTATKATGTPVTKETSAMPVKTDETHANIDNTDIQVKDGSSETKSKEVKNEVSQDAAILAAKSTEVKTDNNEAHVQVSTEKKQVPEVASNTPEKVNPENTDVKVAEDTVKASDKIESDKSTRDNQPALVPVPADQVNALSQPDIKKEETNDMLNQLENPKLDDKQNDPVDYQGNDLDSEEGKEGLPDTQGNDDGEDPGLSDMDPKPEHEDKIPPKRINSPVYPFNGEISERETYSATIQEGFTEEDDHFFPFFLTAIILVILLYVLYHNKNKVSKVVLGLIVEGRQPGRRRNSRGHAYRRLDTLEQAMSGNMAAPPSKIIY